MNVYDKESGIMAIEYNVVDITKGIQVWNGTVKGHLEMTVILPRLFCLLINIHRRDNIF